MCLLWLGFFGVQVTTQTFGKAGEEGKSGIETAVTPFLCVPLKWLLAPSGSCVTRCGGMSRSRPGVGMGRGAKP